MSSITGRCHCSVEIVRLARRGYRSVSGSGPLAPMTPMTASGYLGTVSAARGNQSQTIKEFNISDWIKKTPNLISVKKLMQFGSNVDKNTLVRSSQWLYNEIPIRTALQVMNIDKLPYGLCLMPSVRMVRNWYKETFLKIVNSPFPNNPLLADQFTREVLEEIYSRHAATLLTMSKGVFELKQQLQKDDQDICEYLDLHESLDKFYHNRIGMRLLVGHHLEMTKEPRKNYAGLVLCNCSPATIAREAIEDASIVCRQHLGKSPHVTIHGRTDLTFPYIPAHIYYILFEILKNSMRAVVLKHEEDKFASTPLPPIRLIIADGEENEDVSIKISDEGGGIKRSQFKKIWSYTFSTSSQEHLYDESNWYTESGQGAPLAGFGSGLPLSRLYSKYFGGDLQIISMEGYGTDAYLHLPRLGTVNEVLLV